MIASAPYEGASVDGMDTSPLLHSDVRLAGPGATANDLDDIVIRKEMELLPSGYYGAIFDGVNLLDISGGGGVKLNFTMVYRGGPRYKYLKDDGDTKPPEPFSRMGMGLHGYAPLYNDTATLFGPLQATLVGNIGIDVRGPWAFLPDRFFGGPSSQLVHGPATRNANPTHHSPIVAARSP